MIEFLMDQAQYAHFYAFGLLMLAGLNIPVSEDLVAIGCGVLSATVVPENITILFLGVYIGAFCSDVENYWLARIVGTRLLRWRPIRAVISPERLAQAKRLTERYGAFAILFGRFIPFGVRNALFTTAGLTHMPFLRFALADLVACTITTIILFSLGNAFGKNYDKLLDYVNEGKIYIISVVAIVGVVVFVVVKLRETKNAGKDVEERSKENSKTFH